MKHTMIVSTTALALLSAAPLQALETAHTRNCKPFAVGKASVAKKDEGISDRKIYDGLTRAGEQIKAGKLADAATTLEPLKTKGKPYDSAQVRLQLAYVYGNQHKADAAIAELKAALGTHALTGASEQNALQNLAYMYVQAGKSGEAGEAVKAFAAAGGIVTPALYSLLGASYAQSAQWPEAICASVLAVNQSQAPEQQPYDVLLSAHWALKDFAGAETVLKDAIAKRPGEAKNWTQLSKVYLSQKNDQAALALLLAGNAKGIFTTDEDYKNIASLYLNAGKPADAAEFLEQAITAGKVTPTEQMWKGIAQAWSQSGNLAKTIAAYGEAGKLVETGEYDFYQGTLYSELKQWPNAVSAFRKAIERKGLKDEGQAWLYLGIAQFRSADFAASKASLEKASAYPSAKKEAEKMLKAVTAQM